MNRTLTAAEIEATLQSIVPSELQPRLSALAQVITTITNSEASPDDIRATLTDPTFAPVLHVLAGRQVEVNGAVLNFGQNEQVGMVSIVATAGGDYAEGNIDKRQGAFVSGGTIHGTVIGQQTVIAEQAYNVTGLRNPFFGLRSFTFVILIPPGILSPPSQPFPSIGGFISSITPIPH